MNHINRAINQISTFAGPAEGELMVQLCANGETWLFTPSEAVAIIRDNPRLEFTVTEKWRLF